MIMSAGYPKIVKGILLAIHRSGWLQPWLGSSETMIDNHSTDFLTFLHYHCTIDMPDRRVMLAYTTFPWLA